ncbi:MAG: hypothetical protein R8M46_01500 [Ghiorsea sp.]
MVNDTKLAACEKETSNILADTLTGMVEGLTGVASSPRNELILSVSHIFQRMRGGKFLSTLLGEWNDYRAKGKVQDDYQGTEQHKVCLQELLEFLDKDSPDEVRFNVLKQIFLVAASEEVSDRESLLPQQYMKIIRSLSSGAVIVLASAYKIHEKHNGSYEGHQGAVTWIQSVSDESGLKYPELVETFERELMSKRLVSPR